MIRLNYIILTSVFTLCILNIYALTLLNVPADRWVRAIGPMVFFLIFSINFSKNRVFGLFTLLLLLFSDLALLNYESDISKTLQFLLRGCAYLVIAYNAKYILKNLTLSALQKGVIFIILTFNLYLLYTVADTFHDELENPLITFLFYFQGTSAILMLLIAGLYLSEEGEKQSIFYFLAACGFLLSDLAAFSAYHLQFKYFFLIDRIFYIIALGCLVKYLSFKKSQILIRT